MRVAIVVGARPNFIKAEPLVRALESSAGCEVFLIHTGQHYDASLSAELFSDLRLRQPDRHLGVGSGSRSQQLARIMLAFEDVCLGLQPDLVVVVGDVNSTLAASLVAQALGIRLAHVEAGLRSGDRSMPEEINRELTDRLSDFLFTPTDDAGENLRREGIPDSRIHFVGNVMIDTLSKWLPKALRMNVHRRFSLRPRSYAIITLHRPSNVDEIEALRNLVAVVTRTAERIPLIFSIHPRTMASLKRHDLLADLSSIKQAHNLYPPLSYLAFLSLMSQARVMLTDSGGIQEETTVLGIPCLTMRTTTERPITVTKGTNRLVGSEPSRVLAELEQALDSPMPTPYRPPLWDGRTAERITGHILLVSASPAVARGGD